MADLGYSPGLWSMGYLAGTPCAAAVGEAYAPRFKGSIVAPEQVTAVSCAAMYAVKAPVFSFQKLSKVEPSLGPEMKSTGEIMGIDSTYEAALYKALVAAGIHFDKQGAVCVTVADSDKEHAVEIASSLVASGRTVVSTPGTAEYLRARGVACSSINKIQAGSPNLLELIQSGGVGLMINTPSLTEASESHAATIRRACIETGVPCVTSIDTAKALVRALDFFENPSLSSCKRLDEYFQLA
jgi:carbamoyl-phosphate synthase large subunit